VPYKMATHGELQERFLEPQAWVGYEVQLPRGKTPAARMFCLQILRVHRAATAHSLPSPNTREVQRERQHGLLRGHTDP
jgi:hypothetical protein